MKKEYLKLIDYVIHIKGLDDLHDELIDIGYIGLTIGLNTFQENKGRKKETHLYNCIDTAIDNQMDYLYCQKRNISQSLLYMDSFEDIDKLILNKCENNVEKTVMYNDLYQQCVDVAKNCFRGRGCSKKYINRNFDICILYLRGYKCSEIARVMGISRQRINLIIAKYKRELKKVIDL